MRARLLGVVLAGLLAGCWGPGAEVAGPTPVVGAGGAVAAADEVVRLDADGTVWFWWEGVWYRVGVRADGASGAGSWVVFRKRTDGGVGSPDGRLHVLQRGMPQRRIEPTHGEMTGYAVTTAGVVRYRAGGQTWVNGVDGVEWVE